MLRHSIAAAMLWVAPAMAQGDWRAAAPVLPLDAPPGRMGGAVAIGGTAWGPWQRICREQMLVRGRNPVRDCVSVGEVRSEGTAARLTLLHEAGLRVSVLRTAEGRVAEFAAVRADGSAPAADPRREALLNAWREQFATLSLEQRRIGVLQDFPMPVDGSSRGGTCRAESLARIQGRQVLVARCAVELAGELRGSDSRAQVAIFARMAIDTATGVVSAQGYATRIETFAANGRSNGVVVTPSRLVME